MGLRTGMICLYCGHLLITSKHNPSKRASKYCEIEHGKLYQTILTRTMKRFNLKKFDFETYNPKTHKDWFVNIPFMYEHFYDKSGKMIEKQIRFNRIESKEIIVTINGKTFPYTRKSRTI